MGGGAGEHAPAQSYGAVVSRNVLSIGSRGMGEMSVARIIGVVLIVAGALGLVYGSFSFTKGNT